MKKTILLIFLLFNGRFLSAQPTEPSSGIVQWVKITEHFLNNSISYWVRVDGFEHGIIDCGYKCRIYKLTTTPFSEEGALIINLHDGSRSGSLAIPFHVVEGKLITPIRDYSVRMEGTYSGLSYVKIIVSPSDSAEGYSVTLSGE